MTVKSWNKSVEDMASFLGISIEKVSKLVRVPLEGLGLTVPDVKE